MSSARACRPTRAILVLAIAAAAACSCCSPTGCLFVVVTDGLVSPVGGAWVTSTPATQSLPTDAVGTAFFGKVTPGGYVVTAVHPTGGAGRAVGEVTANDIERLTIVLTPGITLSAGGSTGTGGLAAGGPGGSSGTGGAVGRGGTGGTGTGGTGTGGTVGGTGTGGTVGRGGTGGTGTRGSAGSAGAGGTGGSNAALVLDAPTKDIGGTNLSWTATPANAFATYRIHRNNTVINILQNGALVQYRDQTGQLGVSYSYQIGGITAAGTEVLSNTQTIVGGVYIDVGSQIERMMVDPKRPYLYGVDKVNNSLHFVNLSTNTVDKTIFVGSTPVDLDINLEGTTLYVANFGSTEIGVVDLASQALAGSIFVDTTVGIWGGNPYRLVCTAGDTLVYTSMDQWNDLKLIDATTGAALDTVGSIYEPALAASPDGTIVYAAGTTGLSNLTRFNIVNNKFQQADASSAGGSSVVASNDGQYVFSSTKKLLAKNLLTVVGTFSDAILAINDDGSIAVSANYIFDGTTFSAKRMTPVPTSTMALSTDGTTLYLYDTTSSRIYVYALQ